jgi:Tol biopolymer transport system component
LSSPADDHAGVRSAFVGFALLASLSALLVTGGGTAVAVSGGRSQAPSFLVYERDVRLNDGALYSQIFRARGDGSGQRRLTGAALADNWEVDVSPDGKRIAFTRYDGDAQTLWVMAGAGVAPRQVVGDVGSWPEWPRWSPDGRWLAIQSGVPCPDHIETHGGCVEFIVVDADGPTRRRLAGTFVGVSPVAISWSPDGRMIAFEHRPGNAGSYIALVDVDAGSVRAITRGYGAAFAPRGDVVAVVSSGRIALVRMDGRRVKWVTRPPAGWYDTDPTWSPDGARIAFWRLSRRHKRGKLIVVAERTSTLRVAALIVEDPYGPIVWSPDSSKLAVTQFRDSPKWVYRLDLRRPGGLVRWFRGSIADWATAPG